MLVRSSTGSTPSSTSSASVDPLPALPRGRSPPREARVHEPGLAERARGRVPGRARPAALDLRRLSRGGRRQRDHPAARRRRRARSCSRTARSRRARTRRSSRARSSSRIFDIAAASSVLAWAIAHAGRAARLRRAPAPAELRLRLAPRAPRWRSSSWSRRSSSCDRRRSGSGSTGTSLDFWERVAAGVRRAVALRPATSARSRSGRRATGRCASWRSGSCSPPSTSRSPSRTCSSSRSPRASRRSSRSRRPGSGPSRRSCSTSSAAPSPARSCSRSASALKLDDRRDERRRRVHRDRADAAHGAVQRQAMRSSAEAQRVEDAATPSARVRQRRS